MQPVEDVSQSAKRAPLVPKDPPPADRRSGLVGSLVGMGYARQSAALRPGAASIGPSGQPSASPVATAAPAGAITSPLAAQRTATLAAIRGIAGAPAIAATDAGLSVADFAAWAARTVAALDAGLALRVVPDSDADVTFVVDLDSAIAEATRRIATSVEREGERLRAGVLERMNASSVADSNRQQDPRLPDASELRSLADSLRLLRRMDIADVPAARAAIRQAVDAAQDATLAVLQARAVLEARAEWRTNMEGVSATDVAKASRARGPIDDLFQDAGFGSRASLDTAKGRIFDWCGIFVVASMFRGAGIDEELRKGYLHTGNVKDTFNYTQKVKADRAPASIWADGQWQDLRTYHASRGSMRRWIPRASLVQPIEQGQAADIRPGDVLLIDHGGGNSPSHICMVESYDATTQTLRTIEGNIKGIKADTTGDAERLPADPAHLAPGSYTQTGTGIHVRDMTKATTRTRKQYPATAPTPPAGAYAAKKGSTVFGLGRPSLADFEEHEYATRKVPDELRTVSPTELQAKARAKDRKKIGLHTSR